MIINHMQGRPDYATMMSNWGTGSSLPLLQPYQVQDPTSAGSNISLLDPSQVQGPAGFSMPLLDSIGPMGQGSFNPGFMDKMLGYRGADGTQFAGWGGMALGAASGLMNGYTGLQQLSLFKDQLAQSKKQFDLNFGAQQKLTNSRLADRQAARVAANPTAYESVGSYMAKNGI